MTRLIWGTAGERYYEAGIDRGVLYANSENGVAWNGLVSVSESASGGEATPYYLDGVKFLNIASAEEYVATIQAFSSPKEFDICNGITAISNGLFTTQQPRKSFGFCYRTRVGNDIDGIDHGYKLHLVYNALAAPSERNNATIGDSTEPLELSWEITTTPPLLSMYKPTAHLVIDSRTTDSLRLSNVEDILYGSSNTPPRLPTPEELVFIFAIPNVLIGVSVGDAFMGGYYAGTIDTTRNNIIAADSSQVGLKYALIVAPKSLETLKLYKTVATAAPTAALTRWNGLAASAAMNSTTYPAADYCNTLSYPSDGASAWYLPAMDELELVYRNLKPTTNGNANALRPASTFPPTITSEGENISSYPMGDAYTSPIPEQTTNTLFRNTGAQYISTPIWSSTESEIASAWLMDTNSGYQQMPNKVSNFYVRPVRRLLL